MSDDLTDKKEFTKSFNALREIRREIIHKNQESLKVQRKETTLIKKELKICPCNITELASKTGLDSEKVFYYISALIKFGEIEVGEKENGYFRYHLKDDNKNRETIMITKQSR